MVRSSGSALLLTRLLNGGPLRNAIIVTLPYNVGVGRKCEETFDCFTSPMYVSQSRPTYAICSASTSYVNERKKEL